MRLGSSLLVDFCVCLAFFSRLPCPFAAGDPATLREFSRAIRVLPIAAAAVGTIAAAVMAAASALGLPPQLAVLLAIAALAAVSGAMHEDGLADCVDGFFGGDSREKKLAIMQDSSIGAFGAVALVLSLFLRAASLAAIAKQSIELACAVLVGGAALSRTVALLPLMLLSPARQDGVGFGAGTPAPRAFTAAIGLAALFAFAPVPIEGSYAPALAGIGLATASACAMTLLAKHQIGGQTGDVAGAAQQLAEIAYYLALTAEG